MLNNQLIFCICFCIKQTNKQQTNKQTNMNKRNKQKPGGNDTAKNNSNGASVNSLYPHVPFTRQG